MNLARANENCRKKIFKSISFNCEVACARLIKDHSVQVRMLETSKMVYCSMYGRKNCFLLFEGYKLSFFVKCAIFTSEHPCKLKFVFIKSFMKLPAEAVFFFSIQITWGKGEENINSVTKITQIIRINRAL